MLSNVEITRAVVSGEIGLDPFDPDLVKRNSYLLRLSDRFRTIASDDVIDSGDQDSIARSAGDPFLADSVVVDGHALTLASSLETIALPSDIVGVLSGISNVARLGVLVHATSAFMNAGFGREAPSRVVFELATVGSMRVRLWHGTPICHLAFVRLSEAANFPEHSARTGQDLPGASDLADQFGRFMRRGGMSLEEDGS